MANDTTRRDRPAWRANINDPAQTVVIVGAARTPIGKYAGAFKNTPAHELGAIAIRAAMERAGVTPEMVDEVVMGQVGEVGYDAYNARRCALGAGLPVSSTAMNVNRLCGSGLQAIWTGALEILSGAARVVVAGGDENMTMQPFLDYGARLDGFKLGDRTLMDGTLSLVTDPFGRYPMGETAERVAGRYNVSREDQDRFALKSQQRAAAAIRAGYFNEQIVPVTVREGKREVEVKMDEHPRETTLEKLAALRPAFRPAGGANPANPKNVNDPEALVPGSRPLPTVTAGNSSGINDAAAAVVLMTEEQARAEGRKPLMRMAAASVAGIEPEIMGVGPIQAVRGVLTAMRMKPNDLDVIELNEAFAAQALPVMREAELDPEKVNPDGGAIALGHPIGATGAILTVKALYWLKRNHGEWALVTMCIGGGQGIAAIFQNCE
jgi:acetyl-CoA C-acetyltransferase